jgi:hypothetical protein
VGVFAVWAIATVGITIVANKLINKEDECLNFMNHSSKLSKNYSLLYFTSFE